MRIWDFFEKNIQDKFNENSNKLRDNYTWLQEYCRNKYGKGDMLDWVSDKINLFQGNQEIIRELVKLETIVSYSLDSQINPTVEDATNFLRKKLLNPKIDSDYGKGESRATFELLRQIRDNLTFYGKFVTDHHQSERNFMIVKYGAILSESMKEKIGNSK